MSSLNLERLEDKLARMEIDPKSVKLSKLNVRTSCNLDTMSVPSLHCFKPFYCFGVCQLSTQGDARSLDHLCICFSLSILNPNLLLTLTPKGRAV